MKALFKPIPEYFKRRRLRKWMLKEHYRYVSVDQIVKDLKSGMVIPKGVDTSHFFYKNNNVKHKLLTPIRNYTWAVISLTWVSILICLAFPNDITLFFDAVMCGASGCLIFVRWLIIRP